MDLVGKGRTRNGSSHLALSGMGADTDVQCLKERREGRAGREMLIV